MAIGDKIQVVGFGQGLVLEDYPSIRVYNIDPELLDRIPVGEGMERSTSQLRQ